MRRHKSNDMIKLDLQQFAEGDDDADDGEGSGDTGNKGNQNEYKEIKDPSTGEMVKIPKTMENFVNHLISGTRGAVKKEIQTKYDGLMKEIQSKLQEKESENKSILDKLSELENANLSAGEIAKKEFKKNMDDMKSELGKHQTESAIWKSQFETLKMDSEIRDSFGSYKLCNPEQVLYLFKQEGGAKLREIINNEGEKTGKYETIVSVKITNKDGKVEELTGTSLEVFPKWIMQSKNAHHLANNLKPGGDSFKGKLDGTQIDPSVLEGMNSVEKLKYARQMKQ